MKTDLDLIDRFLGPDLLTYDPYDIWKTGVGLQLKKLYYEKGKIAIPLVAPLFLLDAYAPKLVRLFMKPQEFPLVRAFAVLSALNIHSITQEKKYLDLAAASVKWLVENRLQGYHGACWGLGMPWMTKGGFCPPETPFISVVPYCVEALLKFSELTDDAKTREIALSSLDYLEIDQKRLVDNQVNLAISYGPFHENRIVINGNAYAMMLYATLSQQIPEKQYMLLERASRIFNFIISQQHSDGSWLYYVDDGKPGNFIDCFHSCFVLKNLVKYGNMTGKDVSYIVEKGLEYVVQNFIDTSHGLARRFSLSANPSMAKFNLYDQAELLNLYILTGRMSEAEALTNQIFRHFYLTSSSTFGYQIDVFGRLNKMLYLRWAVMPMIYALSQYYQKKNTTCE